MSIRFPLVDRGQLLFDEERHHVFPVVGFCFQPFAVRLCLRLTNLPAHVVLGLNLGHDAVAWKYIAYNPASNIKPPKRPRKRRMVWRPDQIQAFLMSV